MTLTTDIHHIGKRLEQGVADRDQTGELSPEVFAELRAAGLTAVLVPAEFGGSGLTFQETGDMLRTLARYDASSAVTLAMHTHLVAAQVWRLRHGVAEAEKVLRKVAGGAVLVSTGASDWIGSNGIATRVEGGFRVSARKSPPNGCW
jgi:acyl-CoA dehydrogenase